MANSQGCELTLRELFRGQGSHADPIACVEDLTAELASRGVKHFPHSIWQIVLHLNYWMDYALKRMRGERPAYPTHAEGSGPSATAPQSETEWQPAGADFRTLIGPLSALSENRDLGRDVASLHLSQGPRTYAVRDVLWRTWCTTAITSDSLPCCAACWMRGRQSLKAILGSTARAAKRRKIRPAAEPGKARKLNRPVGAKE